MVEKRIEIAYDSAGRITSLDRYESGQLAVEGDYSYDANGRLTGLVYHQGENVLNSYAWTYSGDSTMTSPSPLAPWSPTGGLMPVHDTSGVADALMSGGLAGLSLLTSVTSNDGTATYSYDPTGQLIAATYSSTNSVSPIPNPDDFYSYDANGNRETANGSSYVTGADNRLLSDGVYRYEYDGEGNRTAKFVDGNHDGVLDAGDTNITVYGWDARNRLTSATAYATFGGDPTQVVEYRYDPENRLVSEKVDSNADGVVDHQTVFVYDGRQIALQFDKDGPGAVTGGDLSHRYLSAVDQVFADEQVANPQAAGTVVWPLVDNLGTVRDLAKLDAATGTTAVADHIVYNAFGKVTGESDPSQGSLIGFTGRPTSKETGLRNHLHRWTDPATAEWLSEDPSGFAAGDTNPRRYCGNSPTNATDPLGLWTEAGVIREFTKRYGDNEQAMRGMLLITSVYSLQQGTDLWLYDWYVDHDKRVIYISDDYETFWTRSDASAADQLYKVLADEFYQQTGLPERWAHFGSRMGSATGKCVFGGLSIVGGAVLVLAPEPTTLTKVGGLGAVTFGSNTAVHGVSEFFDRGGGINPYGEAFGAYGRWMDGAEGEATAQYWLGWSEFLFTTAGSLGNVKLASKVPLRQLPAATREALQDAFKGMKDRFGPRDLNAAVRGEARGLPATGATPIAEAPSVIRGADFFENLAKEATRNPNSTEVVIGKFSETGQSYQKVAAHLDATYFKVENWRELSQTLTKEELWRINKAFLSQQIKAGKQLILSSDPATATGTFLREVQYLKDLGYHFVQDGWVWKAVR